MNSHELARALLARRANDVRIIVNISEYGKDFLEEHKDEINIETRDATGYHLVYIADHPDEDNPIKSEDVIDYDPGMDCIIIQAGEIMVIKA